MASKWWVEISITPVQGFLARARRTRDLWGGSYLLSLLAAYAIAGAEERKGKLLRPYLPDNKLLDVAREGLLSFPGELPSYGSVPNHLFFEAEHHNHAHQVAEAAKARMMEGWREICEKVWEGFVGPVASYGRSTREIWERQIEGFWEFSWVAYPEGSRPGRVMERRKIWRTHTWSDEPGDKCLVLPELQELSGYRAYREREAQQRFWKAFVGHLQKRHLAGAFEVSWGSEERGPKEKICAITATKRFLGLLEEFREVGARNWPSTAYMAALPWVELAVRVARKETQEFAQVVLKAVGERGYLVLTERHSEYLKKEWGDFGKLDGTLFFLRSFSSPEVKELLGDARAKEAADKLKEIYSTLENVLENSSKKEDLLWHWPRPSPYYAFLLADGDRLGKLVGVLVSKEGTKRASQKVGEALAEFGKRAQQIVKDCYGRLIYCGGDDVLAIVPVTTALRCADELRREFEGVFKPIHDANNEGATLSAAVIFANMTLPIGGVLQQARRLLEEQAKEASGRNSVVVGLVRRGGLSAMWVSKWGRDPRGLLERIAEGYRKEELVASGVYHLRQLLGMLGEKGWKPGDRMPLPPGMDRQRAKRWVGMELGGGRDLESEIGESLVEAVVEGGEKEPKVVVDPLLIGIFLGRPPVEEE